VGNPVSLVGSSLTLEIRSPLPRRPVEGLGQGEKPQALGDVARHGCIFQIMYITKLRESE
jgi:hypothetical protein